MKFINVFKKFLKYKYCIQFQCASTCDLQVQVELFNSTLNKAPEKITRF